MRRFLTLVAFAAPFLTLAAGEAGMWKPVLPPAEFKPLVEQAAKAIQEELAAPAPTTTAAKKARGLALLIAGYAQGETVRGGADAGRAAAVRDAAVAMADTLKQKQYDKAKKQAEALAELKADAPGKPGVVALHRPAERDDVTAATMLLFAVRTRGGLGVDSRPAKNVDGIEARLMALSRKPMTQADLEKHADEIARAAYATAVLGQITHALAPEKDDGKKKRAEWIAWSEEMRDAARQLAEAARAKNPKEVRAAASKVNATCTSCHDVFRAE